MSQQPKTKEMEDIFDNVNTLAREVQTPAATPPVETPPETIPAENITSPETPPQTPTVETPAENKTPETPPVETPSAEVAPVETPIEIPDYLKKLSELSDGKHNFTKDDEFKNFLKSHDDLSSKASELEKNFTQVQALKEIVKQYAKENDIVTKSGGEQAFKNNIIALELAKMHGDVEEVMPVARNLVHNLSKMNDLDALVNITKLDSPNMSEISAKRATLKGLGIDISEIEDWSDPLASLSEDDKAIIKVNANRNKRNIQEAINGVQIPEQVDIVKQLEDEENNFKNTVTEFKGKWETARNPLKESLKNIDFKDYDFSFEVPQTEVDQIVDQFLNEVSTMQKEPNDAEKQMVAQKMRDYYWMRNHDKITTALINHVKTVTEKAVRAEHANQSPLTVPETPAKVNEKEAAAVDAVRRSLFG